MYYSSILSNWNKLHPVTVYWTVFLVVVVVVVVGVGQLGGDLELSVIMCSFH